MNYCQTCGKPISEFDTSRINGIDECSECATKTLITRKNGTFYKPEAEFSQKPTNTAERPQQTSNAAFSFNSSEKSSIVFLKVCAFIQLFANVILSFYMGEFFTISSDFEFLIVIVSLIVSIVIFAIEYVFLGMASDMNVNKEATVKLLSTQIEIINTLKAASAQNQAPQQNAAPLDQQYPPRQNSASPIQQNPPQQ